jgi:hypothetical protein
MVRNSGYSIPDADIDLAFQLAILPHCNEYGAKCATSSMKRELLGVTNWVLKASLLLIVSFHCRNLDE